MKKLNKTNSASLRVVSDDQLERVVGGRGHGHQGHGGHQGGGHLSNGHQNQGGGQLSNGRQSSNSRSNGNGGVNIFFVQIFNTTNNIGTTTNINS